MLKIQQFNPNQCANNNKNNNIFHHLQTVLSFRLIIKMPIFYISLFHVIASTSLLFSIHLTPLYEIVLENSVIFVTKPTHTYLSNLPTSYTSLSTQKDFHHLSQSYVQCLVPMQESEHSHLDSENGMLHRFSNIIRHSHTVFNLTLPTLHYLLLHRILSVLPEVFV